MVLQIITYETKTPLIDEFKKALSAMKDLYLSNGCKNYEVFRELSNTDRFIETAHFENSEDADSFDKLDTPQKRELFNRFCAAGKVVEKSVEVRSGLKFL